MVDADARARGEHVAGGIAGRHDVVVGSARDSEAVELFHDLGLRAGRVGDQDDFAAAAAIGDERLGGTRVSALAIVDNPPHVAEQCRIGGGKLGKTRDKCGRRSVGHALRRMESRCVGQGATLRPHQIGTAAGYPPHALFTVMRH